MKNLPLRDSKRDQEPPANQNVKHDLKARLLAGDAEVIGAIILAGSVGIRAKDLHAIMRERELIDGKFQTISMGYHEEGWNFIVRHIGKSQLKRITRRHTAAGCHPRPSLKSGKSLKLTRMNLPDFYGAHWPYETDLPIWHTRLTDGEFQVFASPIDRTGELQKLVWSDIHLTDRTVVIRSEVSKTRRRRFPDLSENAARDYVAGVTRSQRQHRQSYLRK